MRTARSSIQNSRGLIQINFLRASSELVRELIAADRRELAAMKQELALISNASLHIYERNGNLRFRSYDRDSKKRSGITIHEHLGAFQMERYPDNALRRLNDYRDHTVFELSSRPVSSEEFTWSLEADLRSSRLFDRIIARMLLPGIN